MTAFNTDGIDVSGSNVWVHDCDIFVQDDCIAVKDIKNHTREAGIDGPYISENMLFERINASGLGFTIGTIRNTYVKNITFRDCYLHKTVKGIYMKFAPPKHVFTPAIIEGVVYENITMESPSQWPIWIGPAQQADNTDFCHPNPCSLCWPMAPGSKCHVVQNAKFRNITLRNVHINNPARSPGVIFGNHMDTIDTVLFENVQVTRGLPLLISRMDRHETFPGTQQPIQDEFVPSYVAFVQRQLQSMQDRIISPAFIRFREVLQKTRGCYATAAMKMVQNGGGAEQWYLSVILQETLGAVWVWLIFFLFTTILSCITLRHWNRFTQASVDSLRYRWFYHSVYAILFLIFFFSALFCLVVPFRKPKWERIDQYFRCRGVNNGVARGKTWPVPNCFQHNLNWTGVNADDAKNSTSSISL